MTLFSRPPDGWLDVPDAVEAVAEAIPCGWFGDTEAGADNSTLPKSVYLWDAARKVLGGLLPPRNQGQVGSCVSFAAARAIEYTMLAEIARGEPETFCTVATEPIYAGARVEVGGGNLRGDGAFGAAAALWVKDWGVLSREFHGAYDLTAYDEIRCREWGRDGCPDVLESVAKLHPVNGITRIKNWGDAMRALANGYGISLCSNQGFAMARDANGFARSSGRWAHAMCLAGYQTGAKEGGRIDNSWGASAHTGPMGAGDPGPEGFWASAEVIDGMLGSGDCWAFSAFTGFPRRTIDWGNL